MVERFRKNKQVFIGGQLRISAVWTGILKLEELKICHVQSRGVFQIYDHSLACRFEQ